MKETIIQFGEGNFLRGFADYFIHKLNEKGLYSGKAVIVQPIAKGLCDKINEQNGVYNLFLRGIENSKEVNEHTEIHSISRAINPYEDFEAFLDLAKNEDFRFIISNTTEAGIAYDPDCRVSDAPPSSFPAKLTLLLYERFKAKLPGFIIFACELIDNNGKELQKCVLKYIQQWQLGEDFFEWVISENKFCNTLVDRIVTGYPKDEAETLCREIGWNDQLLDTAEIFHLWVIEGDFEDELPLCKAGFNVVWTNDVSPYKKRKVRVLNGAHTSMVFPALLCGVESVGDCLKDEQINSFLRECIFKYIIPTLGESEENISFANSVLERFENPYICHQLKSIALNSVSKFSVRVLPTAFDYKNAYGEYPRPIALSLAALIEYYKNNDISDDEYAVDFIKNNTVSDILANTQLWGTDLSPMLESVAEGTALIQQKGIREAMKWALS